MYFMRFLVTCIVLITWTFLGFFLWTPLLIRMIAYFVGVVTISSFTRAVDIKEAQQRLNFGIEFYLYGYRKILEVMDRQEAGDIQLEDANPRIDLLTLLKKMSIDIIWTIIFWTSSITLVTNFF